MNKVTEQYTHTRTHESQQQQSNNGKQKKNRHPNWKLVWHNDTTEIGPTQTETRLKSSEKEIVNFDRGDDNNWWVEYRHL